MVSRRPLIRDATTQLPAEIATGDTIDPAYTQTVRQQATINSPTGSVITGYVSMATVGRLIRLDSNQPLRLRLYTTAAARNADQTRAVSTMPSAGSGLLFEGVTVAGLMGFDCTPVPEIFNNETPVSNEIAYTLEPASNVNTTATLTYQVIAP